jgi:chaperone LolA
VKRRRGWKAGWRALAATALVVALPAASASGQESQNRALRILSSAADHYARMSSLCADFVQHLSIPLLKEERTGKGRLCERQPDRFAMRFTEPKGDAVVADGTSLWLYYPSSDPKQVIQIPMADAPGSYDFHRAFLENPDQKYEATYVGVDTVADHRTYHLHLVPKSDSVSYKSAEVWIDTGDDPVLRRLKAQEENGSVRTVTLTNVQADPKVDPSWFTFTPPPGTQVIRR